MTGSWQKLKRIEGGPRGLPVARRRTWPVLVGLVAAAAAATCIVWWLASGRSGATVSRGSVLVLHTPRRVQLGQRAEVLAYPGARLNRTVSAGGEAHVEQLDGTAVYQVEPGGPFVVNVPGGWVRVLGTRFKIEVKPMSTRAKRGSLMVAAALAVVAVYQGRVIFGNERGEVTLVAGEGARVEAKQRPRRLSETMPSASRRLATQ